MTSRITYPRHIAYPIKAEFDNALAIYKDSMRAFIVKTLREKYNDDEKVGEIILEVLKGSHNESLHARAEDDLRKGDKLENLFEEGSFYFLVRRPEFQDVFNKPGIDIRRELSNIRDVNFNRNLSAHIRFEEDLDSQQATSSTGYMIQALRLIDAQEDWIDKVITSRNIIIDIERGIHTIYEPAQAHIYSSSETMAMPPNAVASMFGLLITEGLDKGKSILLKEGCNTIGRLPENSLQTDDLYVSGYHAAVIMEEDDFTLLDLGSAGGTRIGQNRISGKRIEAGSVITVGQTKLFVSVMDDPGPVSLGATMVAPPSGPPSLKLTAQSGPDEGKNFPLSDASNIIGRPDDLSARVNLPDPEVILSDQTVSRRHALVYVGADRVAIADLGSRSGTRVDGYSVSSGVQIKMGDRIEIGRSEFTLTRNPLA